MCTCIYLYIHLCIYMHIYIDVDIHLYTYTHINRSIRIHTHTCRKWRAIPWRYIHISTYICLLYIYIYIYSYIYIWTYIPTNIYLQTHIYICSRIHTRTCRDSKKWQATQSPMMKTIGGSKFLFQKKKKSISTHSAKEFVTVHPISSHGNNWWV